MHRKTSFFLASLLWIVGAGSAWGDEQPQITPDVIYGHKNGMALVMHVYRPVKANGAAVVEIVSGGYFSNWQPANPNSHLVGRFLKSGYTVFSVFHGSNPKYTIPEIVEDMRLAVRFIHLHADDYGIDARRIGAIGSSAGGHLALMLATTGDDGNKSAKEAVGRASSRVAAVVAIAAPSDLRNFDKFTQELLDKGVINQAFSDLIKPAFTFDSKLADSVSPVLHVTADDAATMLIHGDADQLVPIEFSNRILAPLKEKRVPNELVVLPGVGHAPTGEEMKKLVESIERAVDWFDKYLAAPETKARSADDNSFSPKASSSVKASRSEGPMGAWLASLTADLRKQNELVGLGAIVMVDGHIVAAAVDGERKIGSGVSVELGDCWHIGSVTKSITATMIARLVESKKMQWSDSIGERFPDSSVHEDWKPVSLPQLLTHTSGAPANFPFWVLLLRPEPGPECTKKRREAVMDVIAKKPANPPGRKYAYSNIGYTIAGAMAETATGVSWEDLVKREVFEPLALTSAGFGSPKSPNETLDQPRGHLRTRDGKTSVSDKSDITPIIGPAGTVHMTLTDLCTYGAEHLRGELGRGKLLAAETYKRLHTPNLDNYAYGWVKKESTGELPYTAYWHNGSNTMWYALVVFLPDKKMTVAVTSNDGDVTRAESAAWSIVQASAKRFNAQGD